MKTLAKRCLKETECYFGSYNEIVSMKKVFSFLLKLTLSNLLYREYNENLREFVCSSFIKSESKLG
jgi:hypothetical protein